MTDIDATLLEALDRAIRAEVEGQHFYLMAASSTDDPKGKEVFTHFAEEERRHAEFLHRQFRSIRETGRVDSAISLGARMELEDGEGSPIFSDSLRRRVREAHVEMTALAIGVQLELNAVRFYGAQAESATDPAVAAFFRELRDWESGHYHYLLRQQESLQGEYWTAGGFAPF